MDESILIIFSIFFMIVLCAGLVMNVLFLVSILNDRKLREKSTNHFVIAILTSDIFLAITAVIRLCEVHYEFLQLNVLVLINVQIGFTADRFFVICFPLTYFRFKDSGYRKWIIAACLALTSPWAILFYANVIDVDDLENVNTVNTLLAVIVIMVMFAFMKAAISKMVRVALTEDE